RRVTVEQIGLEPSSANDLVPAAPEPFAVVGAGARRAGDEGIVDDVHELTGDGGAEAAQEVARFAPEGAPQDAAGEGAEDGAGRVPIEDDGSFTGVDLPSAELGEGAARGLLSHVLFALELR